MKISRRAVGLVLLPVLLTSVLGPVAQNHRQKRLDRELFLAAGAQFPQLLVISQLINQGADVNSRQQGASAMTPLHAACGEQIGVRSGDIPQILQLLLEKGAQINAQDGNGETPLMHVARSDEVRSVKVLLSHGADVNIRNNGNNTALQEAFEEQAFEEQFDRLPIREIKAPLTEVIRLLRAAGTRETKHDKARIESYQRQAAFAEQQLRVGPP